MELRRQLFVESDVAADTASVRRNHVELCRQLFVAFAALLLGFGLLMVHSASVTSWPTEFEQIHLSRHLVFLVIGLIAARFAASQHPEFWKRFAPWLFVVTVALLVLVLVPGIGVRVKGAQRWIRIPGISAQPSELAKIAVPLTMCWLVDWNRDRLSHWFSGTVPFVIPILIAVPLVLIEPDLGTAVFLLGSATLVLFLGGWPLRNFLLGCWRLRSRRDWHTGDEAVSAAPNCRISGILGQF